MPVSFTSSSTPTSNGSNYITNPNAEIDVAYWNLYNDSGRTDPASVVDQDITYTAVAPGGAGNGVVISYIFHATQSYLTPLVTVVSPTSITVAWYNGPTIANNPTATQLKAAWDAVPGAVAIATAAITGTAGNRQYENGSVTLANGGDTSPVDGTGGVVTGVTLTRNTSSPLAGVANFDLGKDANSRQGMGVSTDFNIDNKDKGNEIQISFVYDGSAGMVLGTNSDVRIWIYDITNAVLIALVPRYTLAAPTGSILTFLGTFTASATSINYRLIFHIGTTNATAWDLMFDEVIATDIITPGAATSVPSLVLGNQPVSGSVTDHMVVMWRDGAAQWVPATISGSAIPVFGTDITQLGFATNIVSGLADIYIRGAMDGFSFGPFAGYEQYIDNTAGGISPLPSPFNSLYVRVGKGISSTVLDIQFDVHIDEISNASGVPIKGGLLTNSGANDATGDQVLTVGTNGQVPVANSAATLGIQWLAPIVATTPFTFTAATRTLTIATATNSVAGVMSAADHALLHNALTIGTANGLSLSTQVLSLAAATDSVPGALTAADHATFAGYAATIATKAPSASPTFTGTITTPLTASRAVTTGAAGVLAVATTTAAEIAFVNGVTSAIQTQLNAKAPTASPTFTGDVNSSTGNVLISTIGKGLSIKTGANAKIGTSVLVAGTVTVANTSVTANSRIFLTSQVDGGTVGFLRITAKTAATSFVITSSSILDTSTVAWMIVESIP